MLERKGPTGGFQADCRGGSIKSSPHMCSHATARLTVLTVLLEDPYDCFVHMLLQFCPVKAEAALEGDKASFRNQARSSKG